MEGILDFPNFNVSLFDDVVTCFYSEAGPRGQQAGEILARFREEPEAWLTVDNILQNSKNNAAKALALGVLQKVVEERWKILPDVQKQGIRSFIVSLVIETSNLEPQQQLPQHKTYLSKLNEVLIQIVKREWPHNWPTFISEIVESSKKSELLCENNMNILKMLSEEVFDFSSGQMTAAKIQELKDSLNSQFAMIFELCQYIMANSQKLSLLFASLETLLRFLNWIPLGFIFETNLYSELIGKFFAVPALRNSVVACLTEIGSLSIPKEYDSHFLTLFRLFMNQLPTVLPPDLVLAEAYEDFDSEQEVFLRNLALFFCGFLRNHGTLVEKELWELSLQAHFYLINISRVNEGELFKICLEYWSWLACSLYGEAPTLPTMPQPLLLGGLGSLGGGMMGSNKPKRRDYYKDILTQVRVLMVERMAKPEEVLVVVDEMGEAVRVRSKDTEQLILYKSMRETLIFLTHLDYEDTRRIMVGKMKIQAEDDQRFNIDELNALCWAIGSISGAQNEGDESKFLVTIIKDLLSLCERKRGKNNKALIATNIMYIVGQYPRFLRAHWKFLKTVINKLFEFMHETHPGVQDMACDTFIKIAQKCRRKFTVLQPDEERPFVEEVIACIMANIEVLEDHQVHTFYEAVGYMVGAESNPEAKKHLIDSYLDIPNQMWAGIMNNASSNLDSLKELFAIRKISHILKINLRAALSLGHAYIHQLGKIYMDVLNVYRVYSECISTAVAQGGPGAIETVNMRAMRTVKRDTLNLLKQFFEVSKDPELVAKNFVDPLLTAILGDYASNHPEARDAEVLALMAAIVDALKMNVMTKVPNILESVYEPTLQMITQDFVAYPDIRQTFFELLRAINEHTFHALLMLSADYFKLFVDSVMWAIKHTKRNISELGLNILLQLLQNVQQSELAQQFYQNFFTSILEDVFVVITDTFHKSGFKLQSQILAMMFGMVETGHVTGHLWDPSQQQYPNNAAYIKDYVVHKLVQSFPNLARHAVLHFVEGLFSLCVDLNNFKVHLRDFLVRLKEFENDQEELFLEERETQLAQEKLAQDQNAQSIPGMVPQYANNDEMAE